MKHFLKAMVLGVTVASLPYASFAQETELPSSDLSGTSINEVLGSFVGEEQANQLSDSLQRLWETKTEEEKSELKMLAQQYLAGDEEAGKQLAELLNLPQDDVTDRFVAVGLIVIGIGIMML